MLAVEVHGVSKRFRLSTVQPATTLKTTVMELLRGRSRSQPDPHIQVLRDISLSVRTSQTVGIVGRNGSGKSTLLKLIAGIYRPDAGRIRTRGRLAPLLELGAGFHHEFSGRENVLINGIMLGLSPREIRRRLDEIVRFAELEAFIDEPVRTYSSGMYMRLGFAVAVHTDPDILLIDELLAVGDERFQRICADTLREFQRKGKSIVLVTHDLQAIDHWCDEVVWLDDGGVRERGSPGHVVRAYLRAQADVAENLIGHEPLAAQTGVDQRRTTVGAPTAAPPVVDGTAGIEVVTAPPAIAEPSSRPGDVAVCAPDPVVPRGRRWGTGAVLISSVRLAGLDGGERSVFRSGETMVIALRYEVRQPIDELVVGFAVLREDGLWCYGTNTALEGIAVRCRARTGRVEIVLERLDFIGGQYCVDVAVHPVKGEHYDYHTGLYPFTVLSHVRDVGVARIPHRWRFETPSPEEQPAVAAGTAGEKESG